MVMVDERLFTVAEVAERLSVEPETVQGWLREGKLGGYQLSRRAGWRISESDLRRFLEATRRPGPGERDDTQPA
jgi:excisionase family DNA binding protein